MSKAEVLCKEGAGQGSKRLLPARAGKIKRVAQGLGKKGASHPGSFALRSDLTSGARFALWAQLFAKLT
jgi:hypothetical protein